MLCALRYNGVMEEYRNPFEWTPQSEAWVEAASWIAEEKRARLLAMTPQRKPSPASPSNCACNRLKKPTLTSAPSR